MGSEPGGSFKRVMAPPPQPASRLSGPIQAVAVARADRSRHTGGSTVNIRRSRATLYGRRSPA